MSTRPRTFVVLGESRRIGLPQVAHLGSGPSVAAAFALTAAGLVSLPAGSVAVPVTVASSSTGTLGAQVGASVPLTVAVSASGFLGTSLAGPAIAASVAVTSAGSVGRSTGASVAATVAVTSSGFVASSTDSAVPLTATISASGSIAGAALSQASSVPLAATVSPTGVFGLGYDATVPLVATVTASGQAAIAAGSSLAETTTVTSAGSVGTATGATAPLTDTVTSAGAVGLNTAVAVSETTAVTSAGTVGAATGSTPALTAAVTSTGTVARASAASRPLTATVAASGIVASFFDNFNRANGALGANWVTLTAGAPTIASNQVVGGTTSTMSRWVTATPTDDQFAMATYIGGGLNLGVVVAAPATTAGASVASSGTWYVFRQAGSGAGIQIIQKDTGATTSTTLASSGTSLVAGDVIRLTYIGGVLTGYVNNVQALTVTPTTPITGQRYTGFAHNSTTQSGVTLIDDWSAGKAPGVAGAITVPVTVGVSATGTTKPRVGGLVVVNLGALDDGINHQLIRLLWSDLEPTTQGTYDFSSLTTALAALPTGALAKIGVQSGQYAPNWLKAATGTVDVWSTKDQIMSTVPLWWTSTAQTAWANLQTAMAAQFDTNPKVLQVIACEAMTAYMEPFILGGDDPSGVRLYNAGLENPATGYTSAQAIATMLDNTMAAWQRTRVELALHINWQVPGPAGIVNLPWATLRDFINPYATKYGERIMFTDYGLGPLDAVPSITGATLANATSEYQWMSVRGHGTQGPVGFQITFGTSARTEANCETIVNSALAMKGCYLETSSYDEITAAERTQNDLDLKVVAGVAPRGNIQLRANIAAAGTVA
jgi:hypothetical protein